MEVKEQRTKRIAKNTVILYMRSIIVMLLTLYISRIVLKALGVEDYGLYNVVGGVVSLFAFLRTSLTKSTQRFLNVEMTKHDGRLLDVFQASITIHFFVALVVAILAETIGVWFLNTYICVPVGREWASNLIFQSTVLSLLIAIISVPYTATIIAHEKMTFFALVSIVDAVLKLLIAILISFDCGDKLVIYGYLLMSVNVLNLLMYVVYCNLKFQETKFKLRYDKSLCKDMLGYTSWTIVGQAAIIGTNQGNNILMNMFHSVTANAAMGVAQQVNGAVVTLTSNFQTAFNPQITKSYAAKDFSYLQRLVYTTSKISFFLLFIATLPIAFNIELILKMWLDVVPCYSGDFCILVLCNSILNALSAPLNFTVLSSGKIKWFQIVTSLVYLSDLLILYPLFLMGYPPITAQFVKVATMLVVLGVRIYYAHKEVECIDLISYVRGVLFPIFVATSLSLMLGFVLFCHAKEFSEILLSSFILFIFSVISAYYIGLTKSQRESLSVVLGKVIKIKKISNGGN